MFNRQQITKVLISAVVFCTISYSAIAQQELGLFTEGVEGAAAGGESAFGGTTDGSNNGAGNSRATSPLHMFFIAYRIARKTPDFRDLAMNSDEYKNTPDNERVYIIDNKIQEYRNTYDLLTIQDPIKYEAKVILSKYSDKLKGFFIQNFDENLFLPFSFGGKNYALIPQGAVDRQWIKVEDENLANKIKKASARAKLKMSKMTMLLNLEPVYADVTKPTVIDGKEVFLMSVKITGMDLYSSEYERPLWSSSETDNSYDTVKLQELLKN